MNLTSLSLLVTVPASALVSNSHSDLNRPLSTLFESDSRTLTRSGTLSSDADKIKFSNYFKFQYRDTDQDGKTQHSFEVRRVRLGATMQINERASAKVSYDLAGGTARSEGELKDLMLTYKPGQPGLSITGGQFPLPLGYETATSNSVLEFPERVTVNKTLFNDERVRGVMIEHKGKTGTTFYAGVSNALTTKDKEQEGLEPGAGGQLAGFAGLKHKQGDAQFGIGYFAGKRPEFVGSVDTSPETDRRFIIADAQFENILTQGLSLRTELLIGEDRIPNSKGEAGLVANDLNGYHATLGFKSKGPSGIYLRYALFDPDEDTDGDATKEYGLAWRYSLGEGATLVVAHEIVENSSVANSPYQISTFRVQFKF